MKLKILSILLLFLVPGVGNVFSEEIGSDYIMVKVISRPVAKINKTIVKGVKSVRHLAIVSDTLPHGIWEVGPDDEGMIATTDTVENLSEWTTHQMTQKCIKRGGDYIYMAEIEVNKDALLDNIKLYEESFVGKEKYDFRRYNENWAVERAIYGAGGELSRVDKQKLEIIIEKGERSYF